MFNRFDKDREFTTVGETGVYCDKTCFAPKVGGIRKGSPGNLLGTGTQHPNRCSAGPVVEGGNGLHKYADDLRDCLVDQATGEVPEDVKRRQ